MFAFIANLPFNCNSQWTAKKGPCVVLQVVRMGREPRAEMCELLLWGLVQWHCSACFCFIVILGGQWGFTVVPFQRYHTSYFTRMGRDLKYKKKQSTWPKGCWNQWQLCYRFLPGLDETPDPTNLVSVKKQCCHLVFFFFVLPFSSPGSCTAFYVLFFSLSHAIDSHLIFYLLPVLSSCQESYIEMPFYFPHALLCFLHSQPLNKEKVLLLSLKVAARC